MKCVSKLASGWLADEEPSEAYLSAGAQSQGCAAVRGLGGSHRGSYGNSNGVTLWLGLLLSHVYPVHECTHTETRIRIQYAH